MLGIERSFAENHDDVCLYPTKKPVLCFRVRVWTHGRYSGLIAFFGNHDVCTDLVTTDGGTVQHIDDLAGIA